MRSTILLLVALAGCDRIWQLDTVGSTETLDARDALDAPSDGASCYGTGILRTCLPQPLPAPLSLAGPIDTSDELTCTFVVTQLEGPELCVVAAQSLRIASPVSLRGDRPLVLVSDTEIRVSANVDASSMRGGKRGPGSQDSCGSGLNGQSGSTGAGGGGGGGFNFRG